jgi:two-component system, chemotaxis family, CheB/CheR fusion protein
MAKKRQAARTTRRPSATATKRRPSPGRAPAGRPDAGPADARGTPRSSSGPLIVGIGASAGGLDAFKRFLSAMPPRSGMAFVLVPHLDPDHKSMMPELLARMTAMPVAEAQNGKPVEADRVYVIPPNRYLAIRDGRIRLTAPEEPRPLRTAIDSFLRSLAEHEKERAIGIILSGTGSHGVLGLSAIKLGGGMVMVQDPATAEYDQMPKAAIAAGTVDYVLPPERMPEALLKYGAQPYVTADGAEDAAAEATGLTRILALLRARTKYDFRCYRKTMLMRRIQRRMGLAHVQKLSDYVEMLRGEPDEVSALYKDLLIGVTQFFRDPEAFRLLEERVIPELIERQKGELPIRVWIAGCATGEEAYSLGILLLERFAAARRPPTLQIFATDIDEGSLEIARQGIYPESIVADLTAERLKRFFVKVDEHHYQVAKPLRERIVFAPQNLLGDAPFSRLDLISCRNLLIYLEPVVQDKVLALLHFALNDRGYLFLGPAESLGRKQDGFEAVSKKWRVFRRSGGSRREVVPLPVAPIEEVRAHPPTPAPPVPSPGFGELTQKMLLDEFGPAAVLVDPRYEVLYFFGNTSRYLEFPAGEPTRNLLGMAREGLRNRIRSVCHRAVLSGEGATDLSARVRRDGKSVPCSITARPVPESSETHGLLLVVFQDLPGEAAAPLPAEREDGSAVVRQLEYELKMTRDDLQGAIEELESSNEELKASNEEAMSTNEELQSANEELETAKEELQSLNEELTTVNSQLQEKVEQVERANNDLNNLFQSSDSMAVFLDTGFRIKLFTPAMTRLLSLLPGDIGRPLRDIAPRFSDPRLLEDCQMVLDRLATAERQIATEEGRQYLRRTLPYRTLDNRIDGVVVTFVDITERLAADADARLLATVLHDSRDAIIMHDLDGRITGWSRGAERIYGYSEAEARKLNVRDLVPPERAAEVARLLAHAAHGEPVGGYSSQGLTRDRRSVDLWVNPALLSADGGAPRAVVLTQHDLTAHRGAEGREREAVRLRRIVERLPTAAVHVEAGQLEMNRVAQALTGYSSEELPTLDIWLAALHGEAQAEARQGYLRALREGFPRAVTRTVTRKDGRRCEVEFIGFEFEGGEIWMLRDVTEKALAEQALHESERLLRAIVDAATEAIVIVDERGIIEIFNSAAERMFGYANAEAAGRSATLLLPTPFREEQEAHFARYIRSGQIGLMGVAWEVLGRRKDGTTFPAEFTQSEMEYGGRRLFRITILDTTERREIDARLALAAAEERQQLARELHDGLGGTLAGISMMAEALRTSIARVSGGDATRVAELVQQIEASRQELRRISLGLMPVEIAEAGLPAALEELAAQTVALHRLECTTTSEDHTEVRNPTVAGHVYRIAQEAITNAVRHGKATRIAIALAANDGALILSVRDNGIGMPEQAAGGGAGVRIMAYRARTIGGTFGIGPAPEGGTLVTCRVPMIIANPAVVGDAR